MEQNIFLIYRGKSLIDQKPLILLANGFDRCYNSKLGSNFIQVYLLREDTEPFEAKNLGLDYTVCGNCPLRKTENRNSICYVFHPFVSIWKQYQEGIPWINEMALETMRVQKKSLRLTAYGEAPAVPFSVLAPLRDKAAVTLGYTHLWNDPLGQPWRGKLMASVHTVEDALWAQSQGWKTYRVKNESDDLLPGEIHCPNQATKSDLTVPTKQCQHCNLCTGDLVNVAVNVHGAVSKINAFKELSLKEK